LSVVFTVTLEAFAGIGIKYIYLDSRSVLPLSLAVDTPKAASVLEFCKVISVTGPEEFTAAGTYHTERGAKHISDTVYSQCGIVAVAVITTLPVTL
jgi:hypothetical protein